MKKIKKVFDVNAHIENLKCEINIENGVPVTKIGFGNLAYGTITAIKFNAQGFDSFGDVVWINGKEKFFLIIQDMSVGKNEFVENLKVDLPNADIRSLVLEESQICFADGSVVTYEGKQEYTFELEEFDIANITEREQVEALKDTFGDRFRYKPKTFEVGWICGCGCMNKVDYNVCMSCNTNKAEIFNACTEESIKIAVEEYKIAEQERKETLLKEAERQEKEKKEKNIKIAVGVFIVSIVAIFIGNAAVISGRTTYSSEEEMKTALQGTYTYYSGYNSKNMLRVSGDTVTRRWGSLGSDYDLDLSIKKWNPKRGTFTLGTGEVIVTDTGDLKYDGDIYEKGGSWSSSTSGGSSTSSTSSSYESGYDALKITVDRVTNNSGYTICTGSVKNNGKKTYKYIEVKGAFKDSSGNVVDTDWTYAAGSEGLAPGESTTFRLSVTKNSNISSCSVSLLDFN